MKHITIIKIDLPTYELFLHVIKFITINIIIIT